jgi:HEAT repeat protein
MSIAALAAGGSLAARDDFLHATTRDLSARERQALEERVAELGHPDPKLRTRARNLLVAIGAPARAALLETLESRSDARLLRNACLALGALGDVTSLALLERWFLKEAPGEEPARAALLALARGRAPLSPELSERLRRLALEAQLSTVRECALLCAGVRKLGGLPELLERPLANERNPRVRGVMLLALGECGEPACAALVAPFLDGRRVRDERLRRAALHAAARLADPKILEPLLRFEPDQGEVAACALALGALCGPALASDPATERLVARLGALLVHERERAAPAVYSLARAATPAAKDWLERALGGEFSDRVRAEAALAVAVLSDQQRFLPRLRELATGPLSEPAKSPAVLALARIGDAEGAATIADAVALWKDPELLERGLLLCATTIERPVRELLPEQRAGPVLELWRKIDGVQKGRLVMRLLEERIASELTEARAHWTLARDDLRMAALRELLELDKVVRVEPKDDGGSDGGAPPPDGGGAPPGDGGPVDGQVPRRGRPDSARIELDLRQWLLDYPPFELAEPFAR